MFSGSALIVVLSLLMTLSACKRHETPESDHIITMVEDRASCSQFAKHARFNPDSVLEDNWFVFYYWGPDASFDMVKFSYPTATHIENLKTLLNGRVNLKIQWDSRLVLMTDQANSTHLLVELTDKGNYLMYTVPKNGITSMETIIAHYSVFKQTADNKIIGFLDCSIESMVVMSRLKELPPKSRVLQEAMRLGYNSGLGKSYLDRIEEQYIIEKREPNLDRHITIDTKEEDKVQDIKHHTDNKSNNQMKLNTSATNKNSINITKNINELKMKKKSRQTTTTSNAAVSESEIVFLMNNSASKIHSESNKLDTEKKLNYNKPNKIGTANNNTNNKNRKTKQEVKQERSLKEANQDELNKVLNNIALNLDILTDPKPITSNKEEKLPELHIVKSQSGLDVVNRPFIVHTDL